MRSLRNIIVATSTLLGVVSPAYAADKVIMRLNFTPWAMHAQYYAGIAEGFYEKEGIELEIRSYEWGTFYSDIKKGNFHLYSLAWVGVMDPDIFYQIFHSQSMPPAGDNRGRYSNPELDRLLDQGRATTDAAGRKLIYRRAQEIIADDLPYVPLWWWKNVVVKRPELRGFVPYPDGDLISLKSASLN